MGRTFVIGDVHGCLDELRALITEFKITEDDHVISVGDLIHKGPDSVGVIDYFLTLQDFCKVTVVTGNHEDKQIRWARNEAKAKATGKLNPMKHVEEYAGIWERLTPDAISLLENSRLYAEAEGFLILHGGLAPEAHLEDIPIKDIALLTPSVREKAKWILFTRFVNPKGYPVSLGQETKDDVYWAETYDGWAGHILFGHQPFMDIRAKTFPHATGLDLGCVYGNLLCGVEIKSGAIVQRYYVRAQKQYAEPYFEE